MYFQFPIGFSQGLVCCDYLDMNNDFQFPIGFSQKGQIPIIKGGGTFQFPIGFSHDKLHRGWPLIQLLSFNSLSDSHRIVAIYGTAGVGKLSIPYRILTI